MTTLEKLIALLIALEYGIPILIFGLAIIAVIIFAVWGFIDGVRVKKRRKLFGRK